MIEGGREKERGKKAAQLGKPNLEQYVQVYILYVCVHVHTHRIYILDIHGGSFRN